MSTETTSTVFNDLSEIGYHYVAKLWEQPSLRNRLYFSGAGKARLAHIAGWLLGLAHGGKRDVAEKLAEDFMSSLQYLARAEDRFEIECGTNDSGNPRTMTVPSRKAVLHDDGTLHGFSFSVYVPVLPDVYDERFNELAKNQPDLHDWELRDELVRLMNLCTREIDSGELLTERILCQTLFQDVRYSYIFNGGLLYHGPAGGEVWAVNIGDSSRAWSIHT